jgi:molybdopterin converting factor small subunit
MKVTIASPLRSYTQQRKEVEADGANVGEMLADLERRYAGIRFRIVDEQGQLRKHLRIFVNRQEVRGLDAPLAASDEVHILQALSGG